MQRRSISTLHSGSAACELPAVLRFAGLFDVGSDTRSGVNDNDYKVPFRFTGTIDKLTFRLEPPKPSAGDHKAIEQGMGRARDPPDPRSQATPLEALHGERPSALLSDAPVASGWPLVQRRCTLSHCAQSLLF